MVWEIAQFEVTAGLESDFEAAYTKAIGILETAKGCLGAELRRSIERPSRYRAFVKWETLENHTKDFRGSAAWKELIALVSPFYEQPAELEHYTPAGE
jgi:heme-degrading monooxygenase HmoA